MGTSRTSIHAAELAASRRSPTSPALGWAKAWRAWVAVVSSNLALLGCGAGQPAPVSPASVAPCAMGTSVTRGVRADLDQTPTTRLIVENATEDEAVCELTLTPTTGSPMAVYAGEPPGLDPGSVYPSEVAPGRYGLRVVRCGGGLLEEQVVEIHDGEETFVVLRRGR